MFLQKSETIGAIPESGGMENEAKMDCAAADAGAADLSLHREHRCGRHDGEGIPLSKLQELKKKYHDVYGQSREKLPDNQLIG